jgi:hypothetical protein
MRRFLLGIAPVFLLAGLLEASPLDSSKVISPKPAQGFALPFRVGGPWNPQKSTQPRWLIDMSLPLPRTQVPGQPERPRKGNLPVEQLRFVDFTHILGPGAPKGEIKR